MFLALIYQKTKNTRYLLETVKNSKILETFRKYIKKFYLKYTTGLSIH